MRTCFIDAVSNGLRAEFVSVFSTIEGDPITEIYRTDETGSVTVLVDSTRDRFGSGRWESAVCSELVMDADSGLFIRSECGSWEPLGEP